MEDLGGSPGESRGVDICLRDPWEASGDPCHIKASHVHGEGVFHRPPNTLPMAAATIRRSKKGPIWARGLEGTPAPPPALPTSRCKESPGPRQCASSEPKTS